MTEATISDVARRCGLSIASISRTLNEPEKVRPVTRKRVQRAIDELGYVPNAEARNLCMGMNKTIGLVIADLQGEVFSEVVRGIERESRILGYQTVISILRNGSGNSKRSPNDFRGRADGMIFMAPQLGRDEVEALVPKLPTVLLNCAGETPRPMIMTDNAGGVAAVIEHFVSTGRRQIVYLSGPMSDRIAREQLGSYRATMERLLPGAETFAIETDLSEKAGRDAVNRLTTEGCKYDAISAASDLLALGVIEALRRRKVAVPHRVAVAGFENSSLARHLELTTVELGMDLVGARAVLRLTTMLGGTEISSASETVPSILVVRNSSRDLLA